MPDELIQADLEQQNIVKVLPSWTLEPLSVYAVWPANIPINSIAHALIERIYQSFNSKIV